MQSLTTTSPQGETRWRVEPEAADLIVGAQGFRMSEWQQAGLLDTVKTGPHRAVYRLRLPSGCFYLKHYRVGDWKAVLQNIVRPSRAMLEWSAAQHIADAGISTIDTIAVGQNVRWGLTLDSYLACRAIENTDALDTFVLQRLKQIDTTRRRIIRRNLADALGQMVAALHHSRIIHRDLHAENILVRLEADDSIRLWVIDLHAVTVCRRLTLRMMERNLALLNPALVHELTSYDRVRFFRSYWRALTKGNAGVPEASRREMSNRFTAFCNRDLIRVERKRDKKWADGNRRLIIADTVNVRCRGVAQLGREQLLSIRDDPESLLTGDPSQTRTEYSTLQCENRETAYRVEVFEQRRTSWWRRLLGEYSEVRHAWEMGHACLRRNIPTVRPLAFVEKGLPGRSRQYLFTEEIPHAVSLKDYLQQILPRLGSRRHQLTFMHTVSLLARELRHMHAEGFAHAAMDSDSILVDRSEPEDHLWFACPQNFRRLSNDQQQHGVDAMSGLVRSLRSSPGIQMTHCIRFLKCYLAEEFATEWKAMWREIQRQTESSLPAKNSVSSSLTQTPLKRSA